MAAVPRVSPQQFVESIKAELAEQVMEAVNEAPDGQWIADSEERVRDLHTEMRRKVSERAVQKRVDAAEADLAPSVRSNDRQAGLHKLAQNAGHTRGRPAIDNRATDLYNAV